MQTTSRVILVEDQTIFREMLALLLAEEPRVEVLAQLETGAGLLELCRKELPQLVILDAVLPDQPGIQVLSELREHMPHIKVLMVTAHARPELVEQAVSLGLQGLVTKDSPLASLREAILAVLRGERYLCPEASRLLVKAVAGGRKAPSLTARQRQILCLVAQGLSSRQIAEELGLSEKTVHNHRMQIRDRAGLSDVASFTRYAIEHAWIEAKA